MAKKRGQSKAVLSPESRGDLKETLKWTLAKFGADAALRYENLIVQALRDIEEDRHRPGSLDRSDLQPGVRAYHLSFSRDRARSALGAVHNPRHFVIYRSREAKIEILRILHEGRDLQRHLPEE
ncbi:MAG: type II toxin-antitoxin system RelE/ParE family toxin [Bryobacteraceae bacterium]